jgi:hypothetical protein
VKKIWLVILLLTGGAGVVWAAAEQEEFKPLEFRGKPFFMIGNWDARMEKNVRAVHPFLKAAGMNSVMLSINFNDEKQYAEDLSVIRWFRDNQSDVAVIIDLQLPFVLKEIGSKKWVPVPAEELPARREKFARTLQELRSYGNVLGYSIDELENRLHGTLGEWRKTVNPDQEEMDTALARYMEVAVQWVTAEIKTAHPEALFMPVQAWWTTYDKSDKLYDVLIANEYPVTGDQKQKQTYYTVAYDAQQAAAATRKYHKRCFAYCPPGFNVLATGAWKDAREYTREEIRYLWFTPISFGAMGIMGWRQRRATPEFSENVLFPVMNEIKALTPWLLGEHLDRAVGCSRDSDITEYKVRKRSRMTDNEDNEFNIRPVKTITWIARRNPTDGSVLLLVCNNSYQPEQFFFTFSKPVNATYALELFSNQAIDLGGRFKVELKPYDVKAFILPDAGRMRN